MRCRAECWGLPSSPSQTRPRQAAELRGASNSIYKCVGPDTDEVIARRDFPASRSIAGVFDKGSCAEYRAPGRHHPCGHGAVGRLTRCSRARSGAALPGGSSPPTDVISLLSSRTCASRSSSRIDPCGVRSTRRSSSARSSGAFPRHGSAASSVTADRVSVLIGTPFDSADLLEEVIRKERHVLAPLSQRRQLDTNQRQPVVEIATQTAFFNGALEAGIDRGDRTDVQLEAAAIARQHRFTIAQHAMELACTRFGISGRFCRNSVPPDASNSRDPRLMRSIVRRSSLPSGRRCDTMPNSSCSRSCGVALAQSTTTKGASGRRP